ncbi:hypothetical protein [Actinoplanes xinjiangensis]|uniref:hypothetical protein n=1 Tax=Actinoplanes xinjiangensis TaxID=512350 RepID=UPI00343F4554
MKPYPTSTGTDKQDVINELLAAALQSVAAMHLARHAIDAAIGTHPDAAAALADTAVALISIRDALLHAADSVAALPDADRTGLIGTLPARQQDEFS